MLEPVGEDAGAFAGDEDIMLVVDGHGMVGGVDRPLLMPLGDVGSADADHGFDGNEGAGLDGLGAVGPFVGVVRNDIGDPGRGVELAAVAVPAESADEVEAVLFFDDSLDGFGPVEPSVARADLLDALGEGFLARVSELFDLWGHLAEYIGPGGVAHPAPVADADVDGEDITGFERLEVGGGGAVDDAVVDAQAGLGWEGGEPPGAVLVETGLALEVFECFEDETVDLCECKPGAEELRKALVGFDYFLSRCVGGVDIGVCFDGCGHKIRL